MPTVTVDGGSVRAVGADHVAVLAQNGTRLDPSWVKQQWHVLGSGCTNVALTFNY